MNVYKIEYDWTDNLSHAFRGHQKHVLVNNFTEALKFAEAEEGLNKKIKTIEEIVCNVEMYDPDKYKPIDPNCKICNGTGYTKRYQQIGEDGNNFVMGAPTVKEPCSCTKKVDKENE